MAMSDEFDEQDLSSFTDMVTKDQTYPDILSDENSVKVDKKFILKFSEQSKNVSKDVKNCCKVLHFSSEWNFNELLLTIDRLDPKDFPHLFIFVINVIKISLIEDQVEKLKEILLKFGPKRPLLVQLTSEAENFSIFYYKEEHSSVFLAWYPTFWQATGELSNFPGFLNLFLNEKFEDFENIILNTLTTIQNRPTILRFLWMLNLSDNFYKIMIMNVATNGTESEFLTALDAPFENEGRFLNVNVLQLIRTSFGEDVNSSKHKSVLLSAVENQNTEVIDYLIDYCSHLIQQLPFDHQVKISTVAFETDQLDILCALLDNADYPFPDNLKLESIEDKTLEAIIEERTEFEAAIKDERMDDIEEFINKYSDLKIVYNISNKSAIKQAADVSKTTVYTFLKSRGFSSINQKEDLKEAEKKYVEQQRKQNINEGLTDDQRSINLLCNRSLIHNKKITKEQEKEYRQKIRNWYEGINKIQNGPEFLSVAASCDKLKILFDFEDETVESASLDKSGAFGSVFTVPKWIFIGAKLINKSENLAKQREQQIKGVLAHEMCHYVMKLIYENQENPYFNYRDDMKKTFEEIVKVIDKWSAKDSEDPDDECNEIISSVFKRYKPVDFHPELIVRVVQILSEFSDSEEKLNHLQEKYKVLFEFWINHVVPELQKYLKRNPDVVKLNRLFEVLPTIQSIKYKPCNRVEMEKITSSKIIVVQTNLPKLLFVNIHKKLHEKWGSFINSQNIFIDPNKLNNQQLLDDFKETCMHNSGLKIIVDCSKEVSADFKKIFNIEDTNFIFVVSNDNDFKKLLKICEQNNIKDLTKTEIDYKWSDLTQESQKLILKTKINFQNNSQVLLKDVLDFHEDLDDLFDDQLLDLLLDNQQVTINTIKQDKEAEKLFNLQFKLKSFIVKLKSSDENIENNGAKRIFHKLWKKFLNFLIMVFWFESASEDFKEVKQLITKTQQELLTEVQNQQYVLISDNAGNGKSWAMKNIARIRGKQNPIKWVSYVDLKQFIDEFKAQKGEPEFADFMVQQILKLKQQFEVKIFLKMYQKGKVFILFDGFDEIAPDYAEFVLKLVQNFQQNGGNQLWIATRDYFEVDLKEKLKIDVAYSLEEMTEDEGVDMITKTWQLMDLKKEKQEPTSKSELAKSIETSPNFKSYQQKARQLIRKVKMSRNNLVGLPQLFKMLADGFKDEESVENIQGLKIYIEFINILYKRWSRDMGQIREEANVQSQWFELNFHKFHQFQALLSLFPNLAEIFFPFYGGKEWNEEEVVACGIMSVQNGKYLFIHETFREFFVVQSIAKALRLQKINKEVGKVVNQILTNDNFKLIRMFLFPILNEQVVLEKFKPKTEELIFNQFEFFGELFADNNDNLVYFAIESLKSKKYNEIKLFLSEKTKLVVKNAQNSRMLTKFQDFLFDILQTEDLESLIFRRGILHQIVISNHEIEAFNNFVEKAEATIGREFIRKLLSLTFSPRNYFDRNFNIFVALALSTSLNSTKIQEFLNALENIFTVKEIFEIMSNCTFLKESIFQCCIMKNDRNAFITLGIEIEKYFTSKNFNLQTFQAILASYDIFDRNIFHNVALSDKINVHKTFWELLLKTFKDKEKLKNFIMQKDTFGITFIYILVSEVKNPEIIEFTLKILKENFNKTQFQEILKSNGWVGMTFLQFTVRNLDQVRLKNVMKNDCQWLLETDEIFFNKSKIDNLITKIKENFLIPIAKRIRTFKIYFKIGKLIVSQIRVFPVLLAIFMFVVALMFTINFISLCEWNENYDNDWYMTVVKTYTYFLCVLFSMVALIIYYKSLVLRLANESEVRSVTY